MSDTLIARMTRLPVISDLDQASLGTALCCGVKNSAHPGRCEKNAWLKMQFRKGLKAKVLLTEDNRQVGYLEYLPGEEAWRGVDAPGYLFIHCIWVFYKVNQNRGLAGAMVEEVVKDAARQGKSGVAVLAREGPWLAGPALYLKHGFQVVGRAAPDFTLLARKLDSSAPDPALKSGWERKLARYSKGMTIIRSRQCPHIHKFGSEIEQAARESYHIEPRVVEIKTAKQAQDAPTPYGVFAIIYNGRILADHQISCRRFHNIMREMWGRAHVTPVPKPITRR
jgi:hypothetical protein